MPRKASPKPVELDRSRTPLVIAIMIVVGIGLTVGSIMWGRADSGQIDVSATIVNSQSRAQDGDSGNVPPVSAPAQEYIDMPNGGLVPASGGDNPAPQPEQTPEEVASTTATTTDAAADTPVSEEAGEQPAEETPDESQTDDVSDTPPAEQI